MTDRENAVSAVADAGAEYALTHFRTELEVETKSNKSDLVTEIDRTTQDRIVTAIRESFPDDEIVGEENEQRKTVPESGHAWIVDPIDGTQNYVAGMRVWVTSVALVEDGEPTAAVTVAPALSDRYAATSSDVTRNGRSISVSETTDPKAALVASTLRLSNTGADTFGRFARVTADRFGEIRRLGSAQLTLSLVAAGALDAVVGFAPEPNAWDTVAGAYHVRQAGGRVSDLDGREWTPKSRGIVASNGHVHEPLLEAVTATIG